MRARIHTNSVSHSLSLSLSLSHSTTATTTIKTDLTRKTVCKYRPQSDSRWNISTRAPLTVFYRTWFDQNVIFITKRKRKNSFVEQQKNIKIPIQMMILICLFICLSVYLYVSVFSWVFVWNDRRKKNNPKERETQF